MPWGTIELEEEVEQWLLSLGDDQFGQVERYIDLLADEGVHLGEPFTRQLDGSCANSGSSLVANKQGSPTTSPAVDESFC